MFGKKKNKEKPENIIDAENYKIEDIDETDEEKNESKEDKKMKKSKIGGILGGVATVLVGAGVLAVTLLKKPEVIDCTKKDDDLDDDFDDVFEAPEESGATED